VADEQEAMTSDGPAPTATELDARRRKMGRARRLFLELGVAGLGYSLLTRCQTGDLLKDGDVAPDFAAADLDGNQVTLASLSTTPVLLHFWATWCGVCRQEFSALNKLHQELTLAADAAAAPKPRLYTLAADENPAFVRSFAEKFGLGFPILLAPPSLLGLYQIKAFPTSYYLAADRRITSATVGMSSRWAMKARLSCASR
jgi:peroxiredoxin